MSGVAQHTFLGLTRSLCPQCRRVVDAKIIVKDGRVYFRKKCPEHGTFDDFVLSDVRYFDRHEFDQPARTPAAYGTLPDKGCPLDCGICPDHEQHACIGLIEIATNCNLACPLCFAESGPGGTFIDMPTYQRMVDRFVAMEGSPDVIQLSGGEPTLHPELIPMLRYAYERPIAAVMINTNGIRLAKDPRLLEQLTEFRDRFEVYLQFDGFEEATQRKLRGEPLTEIKLAAVEALAKYDLRCTLVCSLAHDTNLHEVGAVLKYGLERKVVRGVSYQIASFCGRHMDPGELEGRVTMPDVAKALIAQCPELLREDDFLPLPCAHPNCHLMTYLWRGGDTPVPINRLIDVRPHLDLVANSIIYTPERARQIVAKTLEASGGCGCGPGGCGPEADTRFFDQALADQLTGANTFRVTITSFLDAHTFDVRRVMKCCLAHVLPSGHIVPFCAYNTLYRDGHVPLPPLADSPAPVVARPRPRSLPLL
ncbi:MAG: radical SAM protein [Gemmataceae bacterium]|nr:radical SAM protein [Gemmataceae bacterium]